MESPNYLIVELDEDYLNEELIGDTTSVIVNSTIEDVSFINRVATVISAPKGVVLKKGDQVIVHHNIFRLKNGMKGQLVRSDFNIGDKLYYVPLNEVFMYTRGEEDWKALEPFCFISPIEVKEEEDAFMVGLKETHEGYEKEVGIVAYPSPNLIAQGATKGKKVLFRPDSEYKFKIGSAIYYKMQTRDVVAIV